MRDYRIRLFDLPVRQTTGARTKTRTTCGSGSGYRSKSARMRGQGMHLRWERRLSHLRQVRTTSRRTRSTARTFPVTEKYPDTEAHRRYQREYNTRRVPEVFSGLRP